MLVRMLQHPRTTRVTGFKMATRRALTLGNALHVLENGRVHCKKDTNDCDMELKM